jgi:two-component SAPR family response regulator
LDIRKKNLKGCEQIEDINDEMKNHTHFIGFKIGSLLADASVTFVQDLKSIHREYRFDLFHKFIFLELNALVENVHHHV